MKKTLTFVLVLALAFSMASTAFAVESSEDGAGTIEFQDGNPPEIIDPPTDTDEPPVDPERPIDPENPPVDPEKPTDPPTVNPEGPNPENWNMSKDLNLDFGLQTITGSNRTYSSYYHARSEGTRFAGLMVQNESVQSNWVVQVGMTGFFIGNDPTMAGFELDLIPYTQHTNRPDTPQTVNTVTLAADEAPKTIMTITPVSIIGANWEGFLDVLGGSVQQTGEARAEMTWSIVIAA